MDIADAWAVHLGMGMKSSEDLMDHLEMRFYA